MKKRSKYRADNGFLMWEYKLILTDNKMLREYYFGSQEKDLVNKHELWETECPYKLENNNYIIEEVWE